MKLFLLLFLCAASLASAEHPRGWLPDVGGVRDKAFIHHPRFSGTKIVAASDLRMLMPPVYDQGNLGSCTGNGCAAVLDYAHVFSSPDAKYFTPSRLFLYYGAREIEGSIGVDAGAQIRDVITVAVKKGAPPESLWPYTISKFAVKPTAAAYAQALKTQALHAYKCQRTDDVKRALSIRLPVVFGVPVYAAIEDLSWNNNTLPMPKRGERSIGGHCMTIVGHDDAKALFIVRNSWGHSWGRAGHCFMPYAYWLKFQSQTDAWVIDNAE